MIAYPAQIESKTLLVLVGIRMIQYIRKSAHRTRVSVFGLFSVLHMRGVRQRFVCVACDPLGFWATESHKLAMTKKKTIDLHLLLYDDEFRNSAWETLYCCLAKVIYRERESDALSDPWSSLTLWKVFIPVDDNTVFRVKAFIPQKKRKKRRILTRKLQDYYFDAELWGFRNLIHIIVQRPRWVYTILLLPDFDTSAINIKDQTISEDIWGPWRSSCSFSGYKSSC